MKRLTTFALAIVLFALPSMQSNAHDHKHNKTTHKHTSKMKPKHRFLMSYAMLRKSLAADNLKKSQKAARLFIKNIKHMKKGKNKKTFRQLRLAARTLARSKNIASARLAFGRISKNLIAMLATQPKWAAGAIAYRCPMAKGYKKWVQFNPKMGNPYMGKRMLMCGGKTKITP